MVDQGRNRRLDISGLFCLLLFCTALYFLCPAPLSVGAANTDILLVKGPWFFLSIQEVLRYLPPFWGGIILCLVPLGMLCLLPAGKSLHARWPVTVMGILLCCFTALTAVAYLR